MGRRTLVLTLVATAVVAGVSCSGDNSDDATVVMRPGEAYSYSGVAEAALQPCRQGAWDGVRVTLEEFDVHARFDCADVRDTAGFVVQPVFLDLLGRRRDAATVAARYVALSARYSYHSQRSFEGLVWRYANGEYTCRRGRTAKAVRSMLPTAKDETPFQWTMVEAMHLAAACPSHLERLYRAVTEAGYGPAAREARAKIDAIAKAARVPL